MIYGPGCKSYTKALISKNAINKTVTMNGTLYFYAINLTVRSNIQYEVYIPKLFPF